MRPDIGTGTATVSSVSPHNKTRMRAFAYQTTSKARVKSRKAVPYTTSGAGSTLLGKAPID